MRAAKSGFTNNVIQPLEESPGRKGTSYLRVTLKFSNVPK